MKRLIDRAFAYAMAALCAGVFYREFTKYHAYTGKTTLAVLHPHLLVLGSVLLLVTALFTQHLPLEGSKPYRRFLVLHTVGLPMVAAALLARGVLQTLVTPLSPGLDSALSGVAGISHTVLGLSLVYLFVALRGAARQVETAKQQG